MNSIKQVLYYCAILFGVLSWRNAQAQLKENSPFSASFHRERRAQVRAALPEGSVAIFFSAPVKKRSNDGFYPYRPQRDLFYLTGYKEPHCVFLLFKEKQYDKTTERYYDELLFTQAADPRAELYDGARLTPEEAMEVIGIASAKRTTHLREEFGLHFGRFDSILVLDFPRPTFVLRHKYPLSKIMDVLKEKIEKESDFVWPMADTGPTKVSGNGLKEVMRSLREKKTEEEIGFLRKAIDISCLAQETVMRTVRAGMSELEIQGIHESVHRKHGMREGFPPIIGGGNNGCILHYIENNQGNLASSDLVLMDVGAEYYGYTADITRTIPVGGRFSEEQRAIYDLVYAAQEAVFQHCKPGASFRDNTSIALSVVRSGLIDLGILAPEASDKDAFRYLPHGVTHHIGLDVHDGGAYAQMEVGMVFTVEPGIYIPQGSPCEKRWWGIGIRIEDDILIVEDGYTLLSKNLVRTSTEIEALMSEGGGEDFLLKD